MVRGGPDGPTLPSARRRLGPACAQTRSNGPGVHTISKRVHGPIYELGFSRLRAHDFKTRARATKHAFAKACICRATPKTPHASTDHGQGPGGREPLPITSRRHVRAQTLQSVLKYPYGITQWDVAILIHIPKSLMTMGVRFIQGAVERKLAGKPTLASGHENRTQGNHLLHITTDDRNP